ncbi:hypothetical protein MUN81_09105 [Hymenobacter sp. 5317J-9]|uniref:hypothetical protein n=1 Tax=Hymenobacter sp. 5317J-9 TaxID=2932250 RepID=UPI001FD6CC6D|nr:hypothetical protein [Hymenobacter sp. 5317J-9]UOQ99635.1 hypothetical protein MUN81_09105 [Hymenobacter sp. 5317J-9]
MKTKSVIFALGLCLLLLSGCVASVGTGYDYGYYPPAQPYYPRPYYARPHYYTPRPAVVVPVRPYYRGSYHGAYRGGNGYHGGYGRRR